ncbi:beta strand repeat-containing protein [Geminisphaera colitermitum]|uniref:beta strand repeat-containing protein n=1 Tax=Geminisphaera colitermitum TaxID=1148786 RepID=UPI000158CCF7|nr:autotransporter-associated beta strand repeat-containing protein [Geminisphaera colitermitum]
MKAYKTVHSLTDWRRTIALPLLSLAIAPLAAQTTTWTGGGANTNWSTSANWSAAPAGQDVLFTNAGTGADAATVTSIVDDNYTIGSLRFDYMNPAEANTNTWQNIQINSGKTLTVNGSLSIGSSTEPATYGNTNYAHPNYLTIGGAGSLVVNGGGTGSVTILPPNTTTAQFRYMRTATLNLQNLASFSATNLDRFVLGADRSGGVSWISSQVILAQNNTIQASTLVMDGFAGSSRVSLGTTNTVHVDDILIGHQSLPAQTWAQGAATLAFRSGVTGATVEIRGKDGLSGADILVGRSGLPYLATITGTAGEGTLNLEGGTTDARVNNLVIGLADQGTTNLTSGSAVTGTAILGAGLMEAANVVVGRTTTGNTNTNDGITAAATLTIKNGGTLDVSGNLILGDAQQSRIALTSTLNLQLGTLKASSISTGASAAGTGIGKKTVAFNWSQNTTIQNHANASLHISEGVNLTLLGTGVHTFNIDDGQTGTVDSSILGEGGVAKTGEGTLVLNSTGNTYTGTTTVSAGRLIVNGSLASSAVTLNNGAALRATDTIFAALTWNGGAKIEADLVSLSAGLSLNGAFTQGTGGGFVFDFLNTGEVGQTYTLISGWTSTSFVGTAFGYENLAAGLLGTFDLTGNTLTFTTTAIPEPAVTTSIMLTVVATAAGIARRRIGNRSRNRN